jgi:hypothetical protein
MPVKDEKGNYTSVYDVVFIGFAFASQPLGNEGGVPAGHTDKWRAMSALPEGLNKKIEDKCWVADIEEEYY